MDLCKKNHTRFGHAWAPLNMHRGDGYLSIVQLLDESVTGQIPFRINGDDTRIRTYLTCECSQRRNLPHNRREGAVVRGGEGRPEPDVQLRHVQLQRPVRL